MAQRTCFVCQQAIDADDRAFQHHVNLCLDGGAPPTSSPDTFRQEGGEVEHEKGEERCPVCGEEFEAFTDRNVHVERCLGLDPSPDSDTLAVDAEGYIYSETRLTAEEEDAMLCGLISPPSFKRKSSPDGDGPEEPDESTSTFGTGASEGLFTPNLLKVFVPLLERAASTSSSPVQSAVLCDSQVVHCRAKSLWSSSGDNHDGPKAFGKVALGSDISWGCGYRNAQMLLSSIRHSSAYRDLLLSRSGAAPSQSDDRTMAGLPGIKEMQEVIEKAWKEGFDPDGAAHFGGKLVGKRKWIGTTEVYVLMTSLGIRTKIIDFPEAKGPKGAHTGLTKWVKAYFDIPDPSSSSSTAHSVLLASSGSPIRRTSKPPLYLQHQGHSRTIVGFESRRNGEDWLLVLDPARAVLPPMKKAVASLAGSSSAPATSSQSTVTDPSASSSSTNTGAGPIEGPPSKKLRGGFGPSASEQGKSKEGKPLKEVLDLGQHSKLMEPYRVSLKSLSRKSEYQILCVEEHGPPLTLAEQLERKYIQSTVVK